MRIHGRFEVVLPLFFALGAGACGVSQELYNTRTTELDHCQNEVAHVQGDLIGARQRTQELATESGALRDRITTLETDRFKIGANLAATQKELEQLRRVHAIAEKRAEVLRALREKLAEPVAEKRLLVETEHGRMTVRIADEPLFDPGRAELKPTGQSLLRHVASALKEISDRDFVIASHVDPLPTKGSPFRSNWDLTAARAVAVVRFLQGEGVDPRRLAAAGYSEFATLLDGERAHSERRIEILIMPTADELPTI
jgi:chemotaxis protein MotB